MRPAAFRYDMPVCFGASAAPPVSRGVHVDCASVSFVTDEDSIAALLPLWFRPAPTPLITVAWQRLANLDWLGGRAYNAVAVHTTVTLASTGQAGSFSLAIWENDCAPIISGREFMGTPKLYGDVPDTDVTLSSFSFTCLEYGSRLLQADLTDMAAAGPEQLATAQAAGRERVSFSHKYIPSCAGEPDADYPVANYVCYPWTEVWSGQGAIAFGQPDDRAAPCSGRIARTLAQLPVLSTCTAFAGRTREGTIDRARSHRVDR